MSDIRTAEAFGLGSDGDNDLLVAAGAIGFDANNRVAFCVYDTRDGWILRGGEAGRDAVSTAAQGANEAALILPFPITPNVTEWRIVDGGLIPTEPMPTSLSKTSIDGDGVDSATLSGVPVGATVSIAPLNSINDTQSLTVVTGSVVITSTTIGPINIHITSRPYQPQGYTLNVV